MAKSTASSSTADSTAVTVEVTTSLGASPSAGAKNLALAESSAGKNSSEDQNSSAGKKSSGAASDDGIILKNIDMIAAHFQEGDGLLYDKGVTATVKKALMERGIDVVTPATVHGGVLSRKDYEQSRDISSARVLIENVNAAAKRLRILQHVIPSLLFSKATMIVEVCYMLTVFMGPLRKGKAKAKEDDDQGAEQFRPRVVLGHRVARGAYIQGKLLNLLY